MITHWQRWTGQIKCWEINDVDNAEDDTDNDDDTNAEVEPDSLT